MIKRIQSLFLILILCSMVIVPGAFAQDSSGTPVPATPTPQPSLVFVPAGANEGGRLSTELEPGQSATFTVLLGNNGDIPFRFVSYAADAFTARNGGFGLLELDSEQTGPTTWVDFATETFHLEPGEGFERSFDVAVPEGTAPGEYVTGVAMQTADPVNAADEGMFQYDQIFRTVLGIRIVVPGEMEATLEMGLPEMIIEGSIPGVRIPLANTGNLQVTPSGDVAIHDSLGALVLSGQLALGTFYGGHESEILISLPAPLPLGTYTLDLLLNDGEGNVLVDEKAVAFEVLESTETGAGDTPVTFTTATLTPLPDASNVQLVLIEATISNTGDPIASAQVTLVARLDGVEVERFTINQSLALPNGETSISERYLPLEGWTSGAWTFELFLESAGADGVTAILTRHEFVEVIEIP